VATAQRIAADRSFSLRMITRPRWSLGTDDILIPQKRFEISIYRIGYASGSPVTGDDADLARGLTKITLARSTAWASFTRAGETSVTEIVIVSVSSMRAGR